MFDFLDPVAQKLMDRSSPKDVVLVDGCKGLFTSFSFPRFLKGRCHVNQLKSNNRLFSETNLLCRTAIPKWIAISWFRFQKVQQNEFLCTVYNFGNIQFSNPKVYAVNNNTFCGDTAKIGISRQISQNILDLLYRFGCRIGGDDYRNIRLVVAQGMLLWQPVEFGKCLQTSCGTTFTLSTADRHIVNPLSKGLIAIIWLHRVQTWWTSVR